jgi:anti-sigma regulatory factor (Ser/Thr protein kinase)
MPDEVRLSFPAKSDYLLLARLALSGLARDGQIDDELLADLKLAVTEACGNAVRHAYPDGDGDVSISYLLDGVVLVVIVEDQGAGFQERERTSDEIEQPLEGGMGMSIMRAIVDDLEIGAGSDGRGTVVHMTKRLEPAQA